MKLLFVVPQLTGIGGIQASLHNLLHELGPDTHDVSVCVFGNHISADTDLPASVHLVPGPRLLEYCLADFRSAVGRYPRREVPLLVAAKVLRRLVGYRRVLDASLARFRIPGHFDAAIAYANDIYTDRGFVGGANDIVRRSASARRRIAWIHNDATKHGLDAARIRRTYGEFDAVVNVSHTCKEIFDAIAPDFAPRSSVVYNMTDRERILRLAATGDPYDDAEVFRLVTVARLDNRQKRLDRVIDAAGLLKDRGVSGFRWYLVGDGPDAAMLRRMALDRQVDDVVRFEGRQANPFAYIAHADLFVLTSDYEAYGMVLDEALTLGVPVVCTNYPAASEIITDGENGLLADLTVESLAETILRAISDPALLRRMRAAIAARPPDNGAATRQFEDVLTGRKVEP